MLTRDAVRHFGTLTALAAALGITRSAIYQWGRTVPELRQYQLESLTRGKLRARQARARP